MDIISYLSSDGQDNENALRGQLVQLIKVVNNSLHHVSGVKLIEKS